MRLSQGRGVCLVSLGRKKSARSPSANHLALSGGPKDVTSIKEEEKSDFVSFGKRMV